MPPQSVSLDPDLSSTAIRVIEEELKAKVVGQDEAVSALVRILGTYLRGYNDPGLPVGVVAALGPTGTGKTSLVETLCEVLFGNPKAHIRVNCADFRESHQTNRIIGAPPGYAGYKDKKLDEYFTQKQIDSHFTNKFKLCVVLLDEIEKANEAFYEYLLNIFGSGSGRVGGELVDFTHVLFIMTSNLGARKMSHSLGFSKESLTIFNRDNQTTAKRAMKDHFTPEFVNRIDEVLVFNALSEENIAAIFDIQVDRIRRQILVNQVPGPQYVFQILPAARQALIRLGFNPEYGARPLKRVLKRILTDKLANMVGSQQIEHGDLVVIDHQKESYVYNKYVSEVVGNLSDQQWKEFNLAIAA